MLQGRERHQGCRGKDMRGEEQKRKPHLWQMEEGPIETCALFRLQSWSTWTLPHTTEPDLCFNQRTMAG